MLWTLRLPGGWPPHFGIQAVGEDGVVVVSTDQGILELIPSPSGAPHVHPFDYSYPNGADSLPVARVNGVTYVGVSSGMPGLIQYIVSSEGNGQVLSINLSDFDPGITKFAIATDGDVFTTGRALSDGKYYLSRWAHDGQEKFRRKLPFPMSGYPATILLGPDDSVYLGFAAGYGVAAFSGAGSERWSVQSITRLLAVTSSGGVMATDGLYRISRFTVSGREDQLFRDVNVANLGIALNQLDTPWNVPVDASQVAFLADGGVFAIRDSDRAAYRFSSNGSIIWRRPLQPSQDWNLIGNGVWYSAGMVTEAGGRYFIEISALDLGAPLADSAWPNANGPADGSHRARRRTDPAPYQTILAADSGEGAVLDIGAVLGRTYSIERTVTIDGTWSPIGTVTGMDGRAGVQFKDAVHANEPVGFYRVRPLP